MSNSWLAHSTGHSLELCLIPLAWCLVPRINLRKYLFDWYRCFLRLRNICWRRSRGEVVTPSFHWTSPVYRLALVEFGCRPLGSSLVPRLPPEFSLGFEWNLNSHKQDTIHDYFWISYEDCFLPSYITILDLRIWLYWRYFIARFRIRLTFLLSRCGDGIWSCPIWKQWFYE